jgi:hypothetical protein
MAVQISTNVEFIQANTTTNAGFILLPSTTRLAGRLLTIKDTAGTFGLRPLILSTIGNDRFEEGVNLKRLVEPFGYITLASDGVNRWYTIDGTSMNTYTISTLTNPISISTQSVFTSSVTVSTLGFEDRAFNTVSSFYTRSTLLYLGSNIIGGSKCGPTLFVPTRSPFNPRQISTLRLWLDSADSNTVILSGLNVTRWNDKSGLRNNAINPIGTIRYNQSFLNGFSMVRFAAGTSYFDFTMTYTATIRAVFAVVRIGAGASGNTYLFIGGNTSAGVAINFGSFAFSDLALNRAGGISLVAAGAPQNFFNNTSVISATNSTQANGKGVFVNGNSQSLSADNTATSAFVAGSGQITIGGNNLLTLQQTDIGEILIYEVDITQLQRQQVEGYLAWKWGLAGNLPSTHPYKTAPP